MRPASVILTLVLLMTQAQPSRGEDAGAPPEDMSRRLDTIEEKIESTKSLLERAESREKTILGSLETLDMESSKLKERIQDLRAREKRLVAEIRDSENRLRRIRRELDRVSGWLALRSAALYKAGRVSYLEVVLNATGIEDLQRRTFYLKRLIRHDSELLARAAELYSSEREQAGVLRKAKEDLVGARKDLEASLASLSRRKEAKALLLARVRDDREKSDRLLAELRSAADHLKDLIEAARLQAETGRTAFPTLKGSLAHPVSGRVTGRFGRRRNERFGTYTLSNGLTIQAAEGAPVRSVYDGRVIFADWLRGYGRIIILDHGGGYYTLYGHLAELRVQVGQEVKADEVIGLVGDSGSLEGPGLYFEIRHHGRPVDPEPWFSG